VKLLANFLHTHIHRQTDKHKAATTLSPWQR